MMMSGRSSAWLSWWLVLPMSSSANPPRPRLPVTTKLRCLIPRDSHQCEGRAPVHDDDAIWDAGVRKRFAPVAGDDVAHFLALFWGQQRDRHGRHARADGEIDGAHGNDLGAERGGVVDSPLHCARRALGPVDTDDDPRSGHVVTPPGRTAQGRRR